MDTSSKLEALKDHIDSGKYCEYLKRIGLLSSCEFIDEDNLPALPIDPKPPINYPMNRYVYDVNKDPNDYWDYQGNDIDNNFYCHGMVSAGWGIKKKNKYN